MATPVQGPKKRKKSGANIGDISLEIFKDFFLQDLRETFDSTSKDRNARSLRLFRMCVLSIFKETDSSDRNSSRPSRHPIEGGDETGDKSGEAEEEQITTTGFMVEDGEELATDACDQSFDRGRAAAPAQVENVGNADVVDRGRAAPPEREGAEELDREREAGDDEAGDDDENYDQSDEERREQETGTGNGIGFVKQGGCLLYTSPSPRD